MGRNCIGRFGYGPKLTWAKMSGAFASDQLGLKSVNVKVGQYNFILEFLLGQTRTPYLSRGHATKRYTLLSPTRNLQYSGKFGNYPLYTNYRCILFPPNDCLVRYYHSEFSTQHCLQCIFLSSSKKKKQKCRF